MYSTVAISKNSRSGKLVGTHQRLDRAAREILNNNLPKGVEFPSIKEIIYFEGTKGPDGLKRKSPGVDEPNHFILPNDDNGELWQIIFNHRYNLQTALKKKDMVRAAFEAAWMAHAITDGLTPAHHFPLSDATKELMSDKEFVKIFGTPIKGIMRGRNMLEAAKNNWQYWGLKGHMNRHLAFEYGVAVIAAAVSLDKLKPRVKKADLHNIDLKKEFYRVLNKIYQLDMYNRFKAEGWTAGLESDVRRVLLPEIIRMIVLGWASAIDEFKR